MKPGMKMMVMDRMRQQSNENRSEYGGRGRRMIGFESNRNEGGGGSRNYAENRMEGGGGYSNYNEGNRNEYGGGYSNYNEGNRNEYGGGGSSNYGGNRMEYGMENMENRRRRDSRGRFMESEGYEGNRGYGRNETESRRRRDSRGRYMMGDMEEDDEEEEKSARQTWFPPYGRMYPNMHGGYGDVYAEGMIYAPGAQNRPGMMGGMEQEWSKPVDERTARKWVEKMDGGEKFKTEQIEPLRQSICPECEKWEFFVVMNSMYSDYCETAKKMGMDKPEFYAYLAKDFLKDKDAKPHKLRRYMEHIAK